MSVKTLITAEQFLEIAETQGPCDLIRGEVVPLTRAGFDHNRVVANATRLLGTWAADRQSGRVVAGDTGIIIQRDPDTVRGADVAYLSYARLPKGTRWPGFLEVPPELVVEVLGIHKSRREATEKADMYLKIGVQRVWIVDPATNGVHIHQSDRAPFAITGDQPLADADVLPGFSCRVEEFFAD